MFAGPAGAAERDARRRPPPAWRLPAVTSPLVVALVVGCGGGGSQPDRLVDGSRALQPPVQLEGVDGPAILTGVRIVDVADVRRGSRGASCLRTGGREEHPRGRIVERVGVSGESVTLRGSSGLFACDNGTGAREANRRWCGRAFGQLYRGHLRDPRLDIGCADVRGNLLGFVWVEPRKPARYVAVEQPGYTEVYAVAGGLPVRISTTSDIDLDESSAVFDLSEHDATGRLIRRYRLEAHVAG